MSNNFSSYGQQLRQEVRARAESSDVAAPLLQHFTESIFDRLVSDGYFSSPISCYYRDADSELSGYSLEDDDLDDLNVDERQTLHLFYSNYNDSDEVTILNNSEVKRAIDGMKSFIVKARNGLAAELEETAEVFELADVINRQWTSIDEIRFYVITNQQTDFREDSTVDVELRPASIRVWDIDRLRALDFNDRLREPININVAESLESVLPAIAGIHTSNHIVYLCIIPGDFLANLYSKYGSRLLERNVRSFLQAKGSINRGIRETINKIPERFLAYNNGISATASGVELLFSDDGSIAIKSISDFQIVNGGQTTASLSAAKFRDKADLTEVLVQLKITVVNRDAIDEMVPNISRYSNTQNKVTAADFSSNDPFFVALEEVSRRTLTPVVHGRASTRWYFERTRGQSAEEIANLGSRAAHMAFKVTNPPQQRFTKTDFSKFENSWDQRPHLVSLGAEKNFRQYVLLNSSRRISVDDVSYRRYIGRAILFKETSKIIDSLNFGGYRANITAYTIAKISNMTQMRVDFDAIWESQSIGEPLDDAIHRIARQVAKVILHPIGRANIGEWCKKRECWEAVAELVIPIPAKLTAAISRIPIPHGSPRAGRPSEIKAIVSESEQVDIKEMAAIPADYWFALSKWAKETDQFNGMTRKFIYGMGSIKNRGAEPSIKQANWAKKIRKEATEKGFSI